MKLKTETRIKIKDEILKSIENNNGYFYYDSSSFCPLLIKPNFSFTIQKLYKNVYRIMLGNRASLSDNMISSASDMVCSNDYSGSFILKDDHLYYDYTNLNGETNLDKLKPYIFDGITYHLSMFLYHILSRYDYSIDERESAISFCRLLENFFKIDEARESKYIVLKCYSLILSHGRIYKDFQESVMTNDYDETIVVFESEKEQYLKNRITEHKEKLSNEIKILREASAKFRNIQSTLIKEIKTCNYTDIFGTYCTRMYNSFADVEEVFGTSIDILEAVIPNIKQLITEHHALKSTDMDATPYRLKKIRTLKLEQLETVEEDIRVQYKFIKLESRDI